jgi:hypothetical protein
LDRKKAELKRNPTLFEGEYLISFINFPQEMRKLLLHNNLRKTDIQPFLIRLRV